MDWTINQSNLKTISSTGNWLQKVGLIEDLFQHATLTVTRRKELLENQLAVYLLLHKTLIPYSLRLTRHNKQESMGIWALHAKILIP